MRTDIQHHKSSHNVRINNVIRGQQSRTAVDKDRHRTRHVGGKVGKPLTAKKG